MIDPAQAGVSREEQRRRILFELEAPIVPGDEPRSPTSDRKPTRAQSRVEQLERRMGTLRKRMAQEPDPAKRLAIRDELTILGKQIREAQAAAPAS